MEDDFKSLIAFCISCIMFIAVVFAVFLSPTPKKLYEVKLSNGETIIDSLRDEKKTLENDVIKYPKSGIISYKKVSKEL